jgi:glucose-6-phosphate-specific signal transduction histidine kinase
VAVDKIEEYIQSIQGEIDAQGSSTRQHIQAEADGLKQSLDGLKDDISQAGNAIRDRCDVLITRQADVNVSIEKVSRTLEVFLAGLLIFLASLYGV